MSILYHLTILPPIHPECEAISQDVDALRRQFGGYLTYVNPNGRGPFYIPRLFFGFHRLRAIRHLENALQVHHLYNPDPFPFPYLLLLRRPVVYSLTGGVTRRPNLSFMARMAAVTVLDTDSLSQLRGWGLENVFLIRPGIDTTRFTCHPLPLGSEIRLLVGSAPWTKAQFRTKGILALLEAAQREPRLHLVFLWRGIFVEELTRWIQRMGVQDQVTVLNQVVDVNQVLAGVHATVVLATTPAIVKAYPHSLMESLAAGKPVLVSRTIPMAGYVEETGCGMVVEEVSAGGILGAIASLIKTYEACQQAALEVGREEFSLDRMIASVHQVYQNVSDGKRRREK